MATRTLNLIHDQDRSCLQRSFTDPTKTTLGEMVGPVKYATLDVNFFTGKWENGHFVTEDRSGDTMNFIARRPQSGAKSGTIDLSVGASSGNDYTLPLSADQLQGILNSFSVIQSEVTRVSVDREGHTYTITGQDDAGMTILAVDQIDAQPICDTTVETVVAGTATNREVQVLKIREGPMMSRIQTDFSDITAPALSATTEQAGDADDYEIQILEVTGNPVNGEVVLTSGITGTTVRLPIDESDLFWKNAINTDTAGLVDRVETIGKNKRKIYFSAVGNATQLDGAYRGGEYHGVNGQLVFSTVNTASVFAAEGVDTIEALFEIVFTHSGAVDPLYSEIIQISEGAVDPSSLSAISQASGGDVVGPGSATDNGICTFDSTTGKLIQDNSSVALSDGAVFSKSGVDRIDLHATGTRVKTQTGATGITVADAKITFSKECNFSNQDIRGFDFDANAEDNSLSNVETADIASGSKSGVDAKLITGTEGTTADIAAVWNTDGDLVEGAVRLRTNGAETYGIVDASEITLFQSDPNLLRMGLEDGHGAVELARIRFQGYDSASNAHDFAYIRVTVDNDASGSEESSMDIGVMTAGDANAVQRIMISGTNVQFDVQGYTPTTTVTSTSNSVATDCAEGNVFQHTLTENTTLANPTNMKDGATYIWRIIQHASSAKTLAFGSAFKWPGGTAMTVSTGASAVDIISAVCDGTNLHCVSQQDFS